MANVRRLHTIGLALIVIGMMLLAVPDKAQAIASRPHVKAGQFCAVVDHHKHVLGVHGIEVVCAPAEKHHWRWRIYIPAPTNPNPYPNA